MEMRVNFIYKNIMNKLPLNQNNPDENDVIDLRKQKIKKENIMPYKEAGSDRIENLIKQDQAEKKFKIDDYINKFKEDHAENYFEEKRVEEKETFESGFVQTQDSNWTKIGKFFLYALIFLAPLFFLPATISYVAINKQILILFLAILSFICYLANSISAKKILYPRSLISFAVFFVFISIVLSSIFSQSKMASYYGELIQPDSLLSFGIYVLVFFLASIFFGKKDFSAIGVVFVSSLILANVFNTLQILGIFILPFDYAKQASFNTIGSSFDFGFFAAFGLVVIVSASSNIKMNIPYKALLFVAGLSSVVAVAILNIRSLWIEISIAMLLLLAYKFTLNLDSVEKTKKGKIHPSGIVIPLSMMIISFLFVLIGPSLPQMNKLPIEIKPSFSSTIDVAKGGFASKNILIGGGPSTFAYDFNLHRPVELNQTNFWNLRFNQGFSFLATAISTLGVLGVLSFLFLFFVHVHFFIKKLKDDKVFVVSLGVIFLSVGWFLYSPYFAQFIFIFLGLGILSSFSSGISEISLEKMGRSRAFVSFIILTIFIAGSLAVSFIVGKKYVATVYFQKAIVSKDIETAFKNLDKVSILDPDNDQYLREISQFLLIDAQDQRSRAESDASLAEKANIRIQNDIALAVQMAQKATVVNPADSLNWSNLADIYEKISLTVGGSDLFAENNYKEAIRRDPKNPVLQFKLSGIYLHSANNISVASKDDGSDEANESKKKIEQKLDKAIGALEKAIELKPDYVQAQLQLALAHESAGGLETAIKTLESSASGYGNADVNVFFNLGRLYFNNKEFDKAESIFSELLKVNPNDVNVLYSLASVYEAKGNLEKALAWYEKVSALNEKNENNSAVMEKINGIKKQIEDRLREKQRVEEKKVETLSGSNENKNGGETSINPEEIIQPVEENKSSEQ
jgi:tetratricopeptide (TPR) repeat protein